MFRFREVREIKRRERNLYDVDPDKLIDPENNRVEKIVEKARLLADQAWANYDPDKLIG